MERSVNIEDKKSTLWVISRNSTFGFHPAQRDFVQGWVAPKTLRSKVANRKYFDSNFSRRAAFKSFLTMNSAHPDTWG